jgi:hypothetical protein
VFKGWKERGVAALSAVAMLSACADTPPPVAAASRHVSPAAVPAPVLPGGSFDRDHAKESLSAALAARQAGQLPEARRLAEAAVEAWPADLDAWAALADICQASGDQSCRRQADFFKAKVEYANTLPARAAVLGFQTIAEEPVGTTGSAITYDRKSLDTATRIWAFYDAQDTHRDGREMPAATEPPFSEEYPYLPAILVGGVIAGVLTEAKSLSGK